MYFNEIKKKSLVTKNKTEENRSIEQSPRLLCSACHFLSGCKDFKKPLEFSRNEINLNTTKFFMIYLDSYFNPILSLHRFGVCHHCRSGYAPDKPSSSLSHDTVIKSLFISQAAARCLLVTLSHLLLHSNTTLAS